MRVFMLGWEFPPFISGGLGTACYGLTKGLSGLGTDVIFVLPRPVTTPFSTHVQFVAPQPGAVAAPSGTEMKLDEFEHVTFRTVDALIIPYQTPTQYAQRTPTPRVESTPAPPPAATGDAGAGEPSPYADDLMTEVQRYARLAAEMSREESFDVVHAHDWMTFPAGLAVAALKNVPLIAHVHSTEFDRNDRPDSRIYDIERRGMHGALRVVAVSQKTRQTIVEQYGIDPAKVDVVYSAVDATADAGEKAAGAGDEAPGDIAGGEKVVLFLGRITSQKGPEYFLAAAKKVLEVMDDVKFVMAGSGDLIRRTVETAAHMGIGHKVHFTGFLAGDDVERVFKSADLYVMPSVSEPFGIAPLEAMSHDVPVIVSKQSGASEVLHNALKVDFWDTTEMANQIVSVLRHPPLADALRERGGVEVRRRTWADAARNVMGVYARAKAMMGG